MANVVLGLLREIEAKGRSGSQAGLQTQLSHSKPWHLRSTCLSLRLLFASLSGTQWSAGC